MNKEFNNKCIVCGEVVHCKFLCYPHWKLMYRLKINDKDMESIKQILQENNDLLEKYARNKSSINYCKVCGKPSKSDLCIIHKKIDKYLNRK